MPQVYQYKIDDGSHPFSFLSPDEVATLGQLPAEGILGTMVGDQFLLECWSRNRVFVDFMHQIIARVAPHDQAFKEAARNQQNGWVYIIDLRTPNGPQGNVPSEDIIGAFNVKDGQILADSYTPIEHYRVLTTHGFTQLPTTLHDSLLSALNAIRKTSPIPNHTIQPRKTT